MSVSPPLSPPFSLDLRGEPLHVERILRLLPGKRMVYAGSWRGQPVVAKVYSDPKRHAVHAEREVKGATALLEHGLPAPRLLHRLVETERDVLLFERIVPAETALERWEQADSATAQLEILRALVRTVAAMHNAGVVQEDMHLGNFLFSGDRLYTVDGAEIRAKGTPLDNDVAQNNLGLLFAQLHPGHDALAEALLPEYAQLRGGTADKEDIASLYDAIAREREGRKRDYLRKVFRSSSAFVAHKDVALYWVLDRRDDSLAMRAFLADPDAALSGARTLKAGNTATVNLVEIDGRPLIVKRYNLKNPLHALARAVRETRAAISWRNAHRLRFYGLPTPRPVALIEKRCGPFRRVSYFVSEYTEGIGSRRYFLDGERSEAEEARVVEALAALLEAMWSAGIVHGDTKGSNFLVAGKDLSIIDLDSMTQPRNPSRAALGKREDRLRFLRNWPERPAVRHAFAAKLDPDNDADDR